MTEEATQKYNNKTSDNTDDNYVVVGRLGSTFGVAGWIKVNSFTDPIENLFDYKPWYIKRNGKWQALNITEGQLHGQGIIAHIEGFDVKEDAKILAGIEIAVQRDQLPPLEEGEFYLIDLPGLEVVTVNGEKLGQVQHVMETGANEILVIKGEKEHLVPLIIDTFVKKIDFENKLVTVDWDPNFSS